MTTEPKSGLAVGVWFENPACWGYRGTLPVVIEFHPKTPLHMTERAVISRCPACEAGRLSVNGKVKRWLILPP